MIVKCPAGHEHYRLAGDAEKPSHCFKCGAEVVHAGAREDTLDDYAVWCTNAACEHHDCHECADMDCPAWAHRG